MTPARPLPVVAVVLAGRGGARLEGTLAGLPPGSLVLDPASRCTEGTLPPGFCRIGRPDALAGLSATWLLLMQEGERLTPALSEDIVRATAGTTASAYRVPLEVEAFGGHLRLPGAPVRLVRREHAHLALDRGLQLGFRMERQTPTLGGTLVVAAAPGLSDAVANLEADAAALASLLFHCGRRPTLARMLGSPLAASARVAFARANRPLGWGRWILGVFAGYRTVVIWAKLWELRRTQLSVSA